MPSTTTRGPASSERLRPCRDDRRRAASKGGPFDIAADAVRDAVQIINQSSLDPGYVYMHDGAFRGHAQRLVVALRSERPRMEGLHAVQLLCEDVLGPITAAEICDRYVST